MKTPTIVPPEPDLRERPDRVFEDAGWTGRRLEREFIG